MRLYANAPHQTPHQQRQASSMSTKNVAIVSSTFSVFFFFFLITSSQIYSLHELEMRAEKHFSNTSYLFQTIYFKFIQHPLALSEVSSVILTPHRVQKGHAANLCSFTCLYHPRVFLLHRVHRNNRSHYSLMGFFQLHT